MSSHRVPQDGPIEVIVLTSCAVNHSGNWSPSKLTVAFVLLIHGHSPELAAPSVTGLPEPGLVMYGRILDQDSQASVPTTVVESRFHGNGESVHLAATLVNVNGQTFYLALVPFETRVVSGETLGRTPNTFALTSGDTTYTRSFTCDGLPASVRTPATDTFTFSAADRGRVERVDLEVTRKTPPPPEQDSDLDGMPDAAEVIAGTDPHDPTSVFQAATDLEPLAGGGFVLKWASVAGKRYAVERTTALTHPWTGLAADIAATPPQNRYPDASAHGTPAFFYRISVSP